MPAHHGRTLMEMRTPLHASRRGYARLTDVVVLVGEKLKHTFRARKPRLQLRSAPRCYGPARRTCRRVKNANNVPKSI